MSEQERKEFEVWVEKHRADYARRLAEDWAEDCIKAGYVTTGAASHKRMKDAIDALAASPAATNPVVKESLTTEAAPQAEKPAYSIDTDPEGIRARTDDAIVGALALGQCNQNPAPDGHWLKRFWDYGREAQQWRELFWATARALGCLPSRDVNANAHVFRKAEALAAKQAEREPLTEEQIDEIAGGRVDYFDRRVFARAIERAHGIGTECNSNG